MTMSKITENKYIEFRDYNLKHNIVSAEWLTSDKRIIRTGADHDDRLYLRHRFEGGTTKTLHMSVVKFIGKRGFKPRWAKINRKVR